MRRRWLCVGRGGAALLAALALATVVQAQTPAEREREMYDIARELWCPLCAGIRLDACELQACAQMRDEIAYLLAEGHDRAYILAYFEEQYGAQVRGAPPWTGFYSWAWLMPLLVFLALGGLMLARMRKAARLRAEAARLRSEATVPS